MSGALVVAALRHQQPVRKGFPSGARRYLLILAALATGASTLLSVARPETGRWREFVLLVVLAAAVQSFAAHIGGHQMFHTALAFTVAAALLLPPQLVVLLCVLQHVPDWARHRYPWYIQCFNIVNYVLSALVAWTLWHALRGNLGPGWGAREIAATLVPALAFVLVNHALLACMLSLARGKSVAESGLFGADSLFMDGVLAAIGIVVAFALRNEPWLTPLAALPIVLIQRALAVPSLREQAYKDHKTGLLNSRGLERAGNEELARAKRFDRSISVLMCDVDGLRAINNRHGHIAGDVALFTVAQTLCVELRDYDLCGRFGGDEFVVVLPETDLDEAVAAAERIQQALAERAVDTGEELFPLCVSIGAAVRKDGEELSDLIARADSAMYEAKRSGGAVARAA
jgi:diguanylate cyclase (GGDEF)-like protein